MKKIIIVCCFFLCMTACQPNDKNNETVETESKIETIADTTKIETESETLKESEKKIETNKETEIQTDSEASKTNKPVQAADDPTGNINAQPSQSNSSTKPAPQPSAPVMPETPSEGETYVQTEAPQPQETTQTQPAVPEQPEAPAQTDAPAAPYVVEESPSCSGPGTDKLWSDGRTSHSGPNGEDIFD